MLRRIIIFLIIIKNYIYYQMFDKQAKNLILSLLQI